MNWEECWANNRVQKTTFGADTTVKGQPGSVSVHHGEGGGGFSNGVLLVLAGFSIGTIWGESLINKLIGVKHHT
jgi:hypothetical protein